MRIAIVTGASSGIGREFALQIEHVYKELDEIWITARRKDRLESLKKELHIPVRIFPGSLTGSDICKQIQAALEADRPDVRMLVNAAGFGKIGTVEEIAGEAFPLQLDMIDLNCRALTEMTCLCLPWMSKGSRILNVASGAAFCPQSDFAVYAATKAYVLSFSRGLQGEVKQKGIVVTAVCPGPVDTEFFQVSGTSGSAMKEAVMERPETVVRQALLDARKGREVSVCGLPMKAAQIASKVLPYRVIRLFMEKNGTKKEGPLDKQRRRNV